MGPNSGTQSLQSLVAQPGGGHVGRKWPLEILGGGLAFHMLSFKAFGQGLLHFSETPEAALTGPNAAVALAAIAIASYLLPSLGGAAIWVLQRLEALYRADRDFDSGPAPFESGWVRISQARHAALIERDAFWSARVDRELSTRDRDRSARKRVECQVFAVLFLLVLDLACPRSLAIGLLQLVTGIDFARELLGVAYLATCLRWCMTVFKDQAPTGGMIYHPALAQHLGGRAKPFARTLRSR